MQPITKLKRLILNMAIVIWALAGTISNSTALASVTLVDDDVQKAFKLYQAGKIDQAITLFTIKAYEGNQTAQYNLAVIYSQDDVSGFGNPDLNAAEAKFWLTRVAEAGDSEAQFNLAMLIYNDGSNELRLLESVSWLIESAEKDYRKSQYNLGYLAFSNLDVNVTRKEGISWLRKAATENDRAKKLIEMLQNEQLVGVPKLYGMDLQVKKDPEEIKYVARYDGVEIFAFPATRQKPLRQMSKGAAIEILEKRDSWLGVQVEGGYDSWVLKDQIVIEGSTAKIAGLDASLYIEPFVEQESFKIGVVNYLDFLNVLEIRNHWVRVKTPDRFLAWVKESNVEELLESNLASFSNVAEFTSGQNRNFNILDNGYPVYAEDSISSPMKGVVSQGTEVEILQQSGKFSKISWPGGVEAWVYGKFLDVVDNDGKITAENVSARILPNTGASATVVAQLGKGREVKIIGSEKDWYQVVIDPEGLGWIKNL